MTDDGRTQCCPYCSSSSLSYSKARAAEDPETGWLCGDCRELFGTPDTRARWNGNSPLTRKLIEMDPDDLPVRGSS